MPLPGLSYQEPILLSQALSVRIREAILLETDLDTHGVFGDDIHYVVRKAEFANDPEPGWIGGTALRLSHLTTTPTRRPVMSFCCPRRVGHYLSLLTLACAVMTLPRAALAADAKPAAPSPSVVLPLDRTAYFVGETLPLAVSGVPAGESLTLELAGPDGKSPLYRGAETALLLDTSTLSPGRYQLHVNGAPASSPIWITSTLRRSAGSMQDECTPREPQFHPQKQYSREERAAIAEKHWDGVVQTIRESGLTAVVAMAQSDMGRARWLDALARGGAIALVNCDTRPTSFFPVGNLPEELDGMSQRMILTAQANGRYPNFAGFCFGWDTTGYAMGGRRGLMTYWGWGDKTQALRNYIERVDRQTQAEFQRRTGLEPVREVGVHRLPAVASSGRNSPRRSTCPRSSGSRRSPDTPSRWTRPSGRRSSKRLDAWSAYLMGLYARGLSRFSGNVCAASTRRCATRPACRSITPRSASDNTSPRPTPRSISATNRPGTTRSAGRTTPTSGSSRPGSSNMPLERRPTWMSNTFGAVHARASLPGKFVRVAAHGLPWGVSGIGFACEGFSNILGGMNADSSWERIRGKAGEMDVRAGREFLDRFACLATAGRGQHGVGILFSKSQFQRQHVVMGFGTPHYQAFVALTRLGYTPRFVTGERAFVRAHRSNQGRAGDRPDGAAAARHA